ncbi:hypothetical protein EYF80_001085 [Liparis tanakae]|uniref:Uncharacterized protein n=1 Tax=Liparis tanakae TaxID=230148 RepID=A0A4Z2JFZ0_9TELE|nr:hypothetical protein EYF80_001085 [Liparis tanakae]
MSDLAVTEEITLQLDWDAVLVTADVRPDKLCQRFDEMLREERGGGAPVLLAVAQPHAGDAVPTRTSKVALLALLPVGNWEEQHNRPHHVMSLLQRRAVAGPRGHSTAIQVHIHMTQDPGQVGTQRSDPAQKAYGSLIEMGQVCLVMVDVVELVQYNVSQAWWVGGKVLSSAPSGNFSEWLRMAVHLTPAKLIEEELIAI